MKLKLDYGRNGLTVDVPSKNLLCVAELKEATALKDPAKTIGKMLSGPTGTAPFREICEGRHKACIVVSDKTRPVPNKILLPPLFEILDDLSIETIILISCGMHAPTEGKDLEELLGPDIVSKYRVINHHGENEKELTSIGRSRKGVEIVINRAYAESDLRILTGFIEPHFMAGFSGGRKAICPGICG
jgi:lactate racemase